MRHKTKPTAHSEPSAPPTAPTLPGRNTATDDDASDDVDKRVVVDDLDDAHDAVVHDPTAPHATSATPDEDEARKRRRIERFTPPTQPEIASSAAAASATRTMALGTTAAEADDSEAHKRARRRERFAPPTPYEIGMAAAATTAARMKAGRAIDWSARDLPANVQGGASETSGEASPTPSTKRRRADKAPERPAGAITEAAARNPQAPHATSATPDADEARKRRSIERFTPPTRSAIAMSAAAAKAARIAAGRAHDGSAQSPPAGDVAGSAETRQAHRKRARAESAGTTPKRPPAPLAEKPTVAAAAGGSLATGSSAHGARQPGEKNGSALNIAPIYRRVHLWTPPTGQRQRFQSAGCTARHATLHS